MVVKRVLLRQEVIVRPAERWHCPQCGQEIVLFVKPLATFCTRCGKRLVRENASPRQQRRG